MLASLFSTLAKNAKSIIAGILMVIVFSVMAGCQSVVKTPEPPSNAEVSYSCDVSHGFNSIQSSSADADLKKEEIQNIESEIKDLQGKITSLQNNLKALQSTEKSEQIKNIENEIKALQEKIVILQNDLKALQSAEKSAEIKIIENEIQALQQKVVSRQNDLRVLKRELSELNGSNDKQTVIGHIDYLKIGGTELEADFPVVDPMAASQLKNAVGIISSIYWDGGYAEPIQFSCQISNANKQKIAAMIHTASSNTDVEFVFSVYNYDPKAKSYYKSFHTNSVKLKGLIAKTGRELAMYIDMEQSNEVMSPKNFTFNLGVMPQDNGQKVYMAVSATDKFVKKWGIDVAK